MDDPGSLGKARPKPPPAVARHAHVLWIASIMFCGCIGQLAAQQTVGRTMRQLPYFADSTLHHTLQRILVEMDAFSAERSMDLIGDALLRIDHDRDTEALYYLLSYRAEVLYYEGLFNDAMRDLDRCMELAHELADSTLVANVNNLRGLLHENIQDNRQALPYLREALAWFPRSPAARYPVTELHHIHGNLGSYLTNLGRLDSAALHLWRSLELARASGAERAEAVAHWSLGNLALRQQRPDSALRHYERSAAIARRANDHDIGVDALVGRANALVVVGRRKDAAMVLDSAETYLATHRSGVGMVTQRNFARVGAKTARDLGDLERALRLTGEWHRIDSTITARNIHSALNTQAELMRSDRDLEVAMLEQRQLFEALDHVQTTRLIAIIGSGIIMAVLALLYLVNMSRLRHKERLAGLEVLRLQQERTIAELRIREEVGRDMHDDLGAGLGALKLRSEMALRTESDPERRGQLMDLAQRTGELISSMRQIIWAMNSDQGSLEDLVAYTTGHARSYLLENGLEAEIDATGPWPDMQLTTQQRRNIFLVVKECLHNVVKHARAQRVSLVMRWDRGLHVAVQDDGTGLVVTSAANGGNGLRNIRRRITDLGGSLSVGGTQGTRVEFHVPLAGTNKSSLVSDQGSAPSSS